MRQSTINIRTKIMGQFILIIAIFMLLIFAWVLPSMRAAIYKEKQTMLENLVGPAIGYLESINAQVQAGQVSLEEAQKRAFERIKNMRYGPEGKDYFWVNDFGPKMIMHPFRADLNGKDISDFKDPKGKALFVEMVKVCKEKGAGTVDYVWQWKDDKNRLEPKLSYVKAFAPWGWIIGTGAYVNDVNEQVASLRNNLLMAIVPVVLVLLGLLILPLRSLGGIRQIMAQLNGASDEVASASNQVSATAQTLAQGSSEQAASLEEASSSLTEMSSMTRRNADNAQEANQLMLEMNRVVNRANESMGATKNSMTAVHQAGGDIAKIIKTIDEIAFQTNLLALNAAVEAARAGEAGLGFAVVADEVRSLAQRAASAAKDTSELIDTTVRRIQEGSDQVHQTENAFNEVTVNSKKVGGLVAEISHASQEQAQGLDQINQAITQMDQVVQSNAANAEESAAASEQLNAQAQMVREVVVNLAYLMGEQIDQGQLQLPPGTGDGRRLSHNAPSPGRRALMGKGLLTFNKDKGSAADLPPEPHRI